MDDATVPSWVGESDVAAWPPQRPVLPHGQEVQCFAAYGAPQRPRRCYEVLRPYANGAHVF
eukprot:6483131-Amphidinium_carterae.1